MSKRKQRTQATASAKPKPTAPAEAPPTAPSTESAQPAAGIRRFWPLLLLVALVGLGGIGLLLAQPREAAPAAEPLATAAPSPTPLPIGTASYCRSNPRFAAQAGLGNALNVSTSERMIKGLVMYDAQLMPEQVQLGAAGVYQHPSWDDFGYLGPVAADGEGNIYTAPSPRISVHENPVEGANTIYRIDTDSGEMTPLVTLPAPAPPSSGNAYGVLGLIYDCDTGSLYASSVYGSTRAQEVGRLYQIDARSGEILSQYDNTDAVGIAVFNGVSGKRLYLGAARTPEVRSLALDGAGAFVGDMRREVVLSEIPPYWDLRARRIIFPPRVTQMQVRAVDFNYNLVAMSETRQMDYLFDYDATADAWQFIE